MKRLLFLICFFATFAITQGQECERKLEEANKYFINKDYQNAISQCRVIQNSNRCMESIGNEVLQLMELCNRKIEEEDYRKCTTIAACDAYLEKHPNGKHAAQVRNKRAELEQANELRTVSNEETVYERCTTEASCAEYLRKFPNGRHVDEVTARLQELVQKRLEEEEDEVFANCTNLLACEDYLETYPYGRYYSRVMRKKETLQELYREASKTAYMDIQKVEFANTDSHGNVINDFGFKMYASDIKFLVPRIVYNGIVDEYMFVSLGFKMISPDGSTITATNDLSGFTYTKSLWVDKNEDNSFSLSGIGSSMGGSFPPGIYSFEIWYEGSLIYQEPFAIIEMENTLSLSEWRSALRVCNNNVTVGCGNGSYKGQIYQGVRAGLGMYSWDDGSYYIGRWRSGNQNGMAIYMVPQDKMVMGCPLCVYYVGEWSESVKSGSGTCYDKFGNVLYHGLFSEDGPVQTYPMTGFDAYKFECIKYLDGRCYVGETVNGKPHGTGIFIWENGDLWYGSFANGERDGYGALMTYDGEISTGTWRGDEKL